MDEAFDLINALENSESESEPDSDSESEPEEEIEKPTEQLPIRNCDNLIIEENIEYFKNHHVYEETELFTQPISTTNTLGGSASNVYFHEEELIKRVVPNKDILMYQCNFGVVKYPGYILDPPKKPPASKRGRKKMEKKKKARKKQGTGESFNSQITFVMKSRSAPDTSIIPWGTKVFRFKVFRTGKLQVPGAQQCLIKDVVECAKIIEDALNKYLKPDEVDESKKIKLQSLNTTMQNYKFVIKMPPGYIIDMMRFKHILEEIKDDPYYTNIYPKIFMLKYTRQDTKLSIKFDTPIAGKPKKKTRFKIFMRGKVNILGAYDIETTQLICDFLHLVISEYYNEIIVSNGSADTEPTPMYYNIADIDETTSERILQKQDDWLKIPWISEKDCEDIIAAAEAEYDNNYTEALAEIENLQLDI